MTKRLLLILASLGILLRIVPIWLMPTWYDENFTILLARLPIDRLLAATAGDVHPPLWYLICWPLAHIPGLPAWAVIRLPALLFSILCLWIWWLILQNMVTSERVRLVAFGLFCLLPQQVFYAQEGRMYSLFTLLVLTAWLAILKREWCWLTLATIAMLYLHNYGLLYAAALWVAAMIHDRHHWPDWTSAMATAILAYLPWVLVLLGQVNGISGSYWMLRVSLPSVLGDLAHSFFVNGELKTDMVNFAVFYGVLVWVLIWSIRRRSLDLATAALAFIPVILAAAISFTWQPIMLWRALIPSGAFICLILAQPVEDLKLRPLLLLAVFFIPALIVNLVATEIRYKWGGPVLIREDSVIDMIDSQWQEGDLLYYVNDGVFVSGSVSWQHINNAIRVEPCGSVRGGLSPQTRSALGMVTGPLPDRVTGRTWVISAETPLNPPCENDYLQSHGLLETEPLECSQDTELVRSCVYLVEP